MNSLPELWSLILANSLRASVLIAGVLLLRWLLRGRLPALCFHVLWFLVALRLLAPSVPQSAWSIFNLRSAAASVPITQPVSAPAAWTVRLMESAGSPRKATETARPAKTETVDWLPLVWLAGFTTHLLLLAVGTWKWRRRLRPAMEFTGGPLLDLARQCAGEIGWRGRLRLRETEAISNPAVFGLWRPCLLLPRGLAERLGPEELRYVFLHELMHLRRCDLAMLWLHAFVRAVHWFNPLVWLATSRARLDVEMACDEAVLARLEPGGRMAYGEALLQLARAAFSPRPALAAGMVESRRALRTRLQGIASFLPRSRARLATGLLLAGLAAIALGAEEKPAPPAPPAPPPAKKPATSIVTRVEDAAPPALPASPAVTTPTPQWADGWKILAVNLPITGDMGDAYVDLQTPGGRKLTLARGVWSKEGPMLERVEWSGSPVRARATLRQGEERAALFAEAALVSRKEDLEPLRSQVEIETKFIEMTPAALKETLGGLMGAMPEQTSAGLAALANLAGVLDPTQTGEFLGRLHHQKGADMLSAPRITTKSGQRAAVEIIREFVYPSEYEPKVKGMPLTPKAFETRNVGVTLEVTAALGEDGVIDLELTPEVTEFLGFINFETKKPVTPSPDFAEALAERTQKPLPKSWEKGPLQPIFSTRKVTTSVTIFDGQTIFLSNLRETEKTEPFTNAEKAGKQLMVLITAKRVLSSQPPR